MIDDFAVFIMVWGNPDRDFTYRTLRKSGYTGRIYLVADNLDKALDGYKKKYGDELLVFDKLEAQERFDGGDNSGDLRSTLYSANTIKDLAIKLGIKYFCIYCDDYNKFAYRMGANREYVTGKYVGNLDYIYSCLIDYYKSIPALSIAMAQTGDYIGGRENNFHKSVNLRRKVMNSFLCSVDRPFDFVGRMNEDVVTYVNLGGRGNLFMTYPFIVIQQKDTQSSSGGLTDLYRDYGTYVKSFFAVMYNPSCVNIGRMGENHKRIHHLINWDSAVPCIIREDYRKAND